MYSYTDRVSYSEVDEKLKLNYYALINYMQDCSCFNSDDVGFGLEYLTPRRLGWFVTNYEIHINRLPVYSEKIVVSTYPHNFRGMMGSRIYQIATTDGEILAYADSLWVLMDLATLKPSRVPEDMQAAYETTPPENSFSFSGSRLRQAANLSQVGDFTVSEMYIDTNGHMNNSFYIDVTRRFLPTCSFDTIVINYKKAAQLQDELQVYMAPLDTGYQVVLKKNDEIYTIVEYR